MEAFTHVSDMYDGALKPRLLHTLIKDHLPDEKHPFSNPSELSRVVSIVRTHHLLAEAITDEMSQKQIERWKSAVDLWVDCMLTLTSSDMPDKCWAGISLLGFTCQECSSPRFLESCSEWFEKLLQFLQSPASSHFVRVASVASMSDLFSRLSGFPNVKKDGSSFAAKVVQPVLKLLNDESSEVILEGALHLLCTIMTSFPFAVQRNYDSVEFALASKLLSGGFSQHLLKKLAYSLALLPKSRGDAESWSVLMQKILVIINDQLNHSFQGLEEETKRYEFVKLLVPPGKDPPAALGGYISAEKASYKATKKSEQSSVSIVSTLLHCCCAMLTNSYPFKVNVPVRTLLVLVDRVLMVNGSLSQMSMPFVTAKQQEDICSELPVLHSYALELLTAVVKGVGSQLLPHAALTARIITMYFKTCALPELRIKVYSIARILLISMGVGMALCLAQEVVNNAFVDLSTIRKKGPGTSSLSNSNAATKALLQPKSRKRKHKSMTGSLQHQEHDEVSFSAADAPKNYPATPISLRIAVLEALEVLITVAGSLKCEIWRSKVDNLLIVIAVDSFEGWVSEEINTFEQKESAVTSADLQLAALRALLASFLSFSRARPPHLAQGLQLFHKGKQLIGTKLSEFCAYALLALEVLIHPRALPLVDYSVSRNSFGEAHSNFGGGCASGQNISNPFRSQQVGYDTPESDDDLCQKWLEDGTEADVPLAEGAKQPEEPFGMSRDKDPSSTKEPERSKMSETATCADIEMTTVEDENVNKSDRPGESAMQFHPIPCTSISHAEASCRSVVVESVPEKIVADSTVPRTGSKMESSQEASIGKDSESAYLSDKMPRTSDLNKDQGFASKLDHDGSSDDDDDLPDIVDADPDSDSS
ncbi:proline-, glutamic acid- and leucine-rich protein 1 isoform X1 [Neltuma alba]|uniref:proline-, glutamic acid- and leucine-rich protein 1 isoform X1 n=2 Tax=Neltuma alba TaxID=207710 RepID=UPI0010A5A0E4|nr:proline-, glutamic acid- and leucine-rich protein 1-like isoform X1 [Prosopis alba]